MNDVPAGALNMYEHFKHHPIDLARIPRSNDEYDFDTPFMILPVYIFQGLDEPRPSSLRGARGAPQLHRCLRHRASTVMSSLNRQLCGHFSITFVAEASVTSRALVTAYQRCQAAYHLLSERTSLLSCTCAAFFVSSDREDIYVFDIILTLWGD